MTELAQIIVGNVFLQAIAVITAFGGAIIFLWKNRRPILSLILTPISWIMGRIFVPYSISIKQVEIGLEHPSYYLSVLFRHLVVIAGFTLLWFTGRGLTDKLSQIADSDKGVLTVVVSLTVLNNVSSLIVGARLGEIWFLTTRLIRKVEAERSDKP